jgi:hypothetical protein
MDGTWLATGSLKDRHIAKEKALSVVGSLDLNEIALRTRLTMIGSTNGIDPSIRIDPSNRTNPSIKIDPSID